MKKFLIILSCCALFLQCKKVKENFLIKGDWVVEACYMNGGSINLMNNALPYFEEGEGRYQSKFYKDGLCLGQYYTHDTLNYEVLGNWEFRKKKVYMKMDVYINGEFDFQKSGKREYTLFSDSNYIDLYDMGYVSLLVKIKKL
tara:strand:- start:239 stop:667 length:429 start_codon:yes stop_codon:yes gene_type:complete